MASNKTKIEFEKVLVLGGAGFIGRSVADELADSGYLVTIYDLAEPGELKQNQRYIKGDILNVELLESACKDVDVIYNFVAIAGIEDAQNNVPGTVNINILGNVNVLECIKKFKISKYVFASSIYVYSRFGGFYRCSKQASELYIEEYKTDAMR